MRRDFLQVPVQRITKYPLLLGRLLRATAQQDVEMREALREAQAKVESYLTAINAVWKHWIFSQAQKHDEEFEFKWKIFLVIVFMTDRGETSQEAKELGTVSRPWRRGYSVPNLNVNATSNNNSTIQRPSGEELMNLRLRKVKHGE